MMVALRVGLWVDSKAVRKASLWDASKAVMMGVTSAATTAASMVASMAGYLVD